MPTAKFFGDVDLNGHKFVNYGQSGDNLATITDVARLTKDICGFPNRTDSRFYLIGNTFYIEPVDPTAGYYVYFYGKEFHKTSTESVQLSNIDGPHYVFFDPNGVLTQSLLFPGFENMIYISFIYWNTTMGGPVVLGEERHSSSRDVDMHRYLHFTRGTAFDSGLAMVGYTLNVTSNAALNFGVETGAIWDEDMQHNIINNVIQPASSAPPFQRQNISDPCAAPVMYYLNGKWTLTYQANGSNTTLPWLFDSTTGLLQYNDVSSTGALTTCANGNYVTYFLYATHDINTPILLMLGQRQDGDLTSADNNNVTANLSMINLPFQEMKVLYKIILQTRNSFSGATHNGIQVRARIARVSDQRYSTPLPVSSDVTTSFMHNNLAGRDLPDAHPCNVITTVDPAGSFGRTIVHPDNGVTYYVQDALHDLDARIPICMRGQVVGSTGAMDSTNYSSESYGRTLTTSRTATGSYTINYSTVGTPAKMPLVFVTIGPVSNTNKYFANVNSVTTTSATVSTIDMTTLAAVDANFSFVIMF